MVIWEQEKICKICNKYIKFYQKKVNIDTYAGDNAINRVWNHLKCKEGK